MATLEFKIDHSGICLDTCAIFPHVKVGSYTCTHCANCIAFDYDEKKIKCKQIKIIIKIN